MIIDKRPDQNEQYNFIYPRFLWIDGLPIWKENSIDGEKEIYALFEDSAATWILKDDCVIMLQIFIGIDREKIKNVNDLYSMLNDSSIKAKEICVEKYFLDGVHPYQLSQPLSELLVGYSHKAVKVNEIQKSRPNGIEEKKKESLFCKIINKLKLIKSCQIKF